MSEALRRSSPRHTASRPFGRDILSLLMVVAALCGMGSVWAFQGTLSVRAVVADLTLTGLSRDAWHRFQDGDMASQLALCPLAGTELFQLQAPVPIDGEVDLTADGLKHVGRCALQARWHSRACGSVGVGLSDERSAG